MVGHVLRYNKKLQYTITKLGATKIQNTAMKIVKFIHTSAEKCFKYRHLRWVDVGLRENCEKMKNEVKRCKPTYKNGRKTR